MLSDLLQSTNVYVFSRNFLKRGLRRTLDQSSPRSHYETVSNDQKKERVVIAESANTCIIDEAGYASPVQVMCFLLLCGEFNPNNCEQVLPTPSTFSAIQFPAFVSSDAAKKLWPKSFLEDCVDKGVPTLHLRVQCWMHEQLYAAANAIVYEGRIALHSWRPV